MDYNDYLLKRKQIVEKNENPIGNILNDEEVKVDEYLQKLKKEVYETIDEAHLYKMPILKDLRIRETKLYQFVKQIPKGADLHVHAASLLPARKLIKFMYTSEKLLVNKDNFKIVAVSKANDKSNCFTMKYLLDNALLSEDEIITRWTLLGLKHQQNVWNLFEELLEIYDALEDDLTLLYDYYVYAFNDYLENGVFHLEIHTVFSEFYERTYELAKVIRQAYYDVKKKHPELIVSIICASLKYQDIDIEIVKTYLNNALKLRKEIKDEFDENNVHDFVIGFDFVNEEDKSMTLKDLAAIIIESQKENPDFRLFIHCGESLLAQSNNLIDAYLLEAKRVGHGMNLYRYPDLLEEYRKKEICLEVCLISNQTLRYVKDLRLHPGLEYLRRGLAICLCSDDPNVLENEQLSDDFFAAIICWDLHLADIKQLAINSLTYSGVDFYQLKELRRHFITVWKNFIRGLEI